MDATRTRTGAATSPDRRYDRTVTDRRLRALTIAAAIAGASGVAGFGFLAAQGPTPTTAQAVVMARPHASARPCDDARMSTLREP
jgi:hypothetical protein